MIDHLSVVVSDYEKSKAFYLQALAPTGHSRLVELPAAHGGRTPSAGFCPADGTDFWISQGVTIKPPIHIAFRVSSRATVDASPTCRTVRAESRSMTASLHGCARPAGTVIHLAARQSLHRRNCRMMRVMRKTTPNARAAAKDATHERIVSVAARAIRRSGYDGTGVADIMKEAGLTHGAFYSHFASREAMLAEAAGRACAESAAGAAEVAAGAPPGMALKAMLAAYLSREHVEQLEAGCPLAALGSETSRQAPEVRRVATRHIKATIDLLARQSPDWGQHGAHERALVTLSIMVGAVMLARAVDEPGLSDSLREAALKHLTSIGH